MPLHLGHINLIEFAEKKCDELLVLLCATEIEPIKAADRFNWLVKTFASVEKIKPRLLIYDDKILPNTSVSSQKVSELWAEYLKDNVEPIDIIFSSVAYGEYLAGFLNCECITFDQYRQNTPISSTLIRKQPFKYWDFIAPAAKPYFVKKVCLYGSESTGKSTLSVRLAEFYNTEYVPEMAREILENTHECTRQHLEEIAALHASAIIDKVTRANRLLFIDTDLNITRSYSKFLFNEELTVPQWIEDANRLDLYLYLDIDAEFVQDGTRLNESERTLLNLSHKEELDKRGIKYRLIQGDWDDRFEKAIRIINDLCNPLM